MNTTSNTPPLEVLAAGPGWLVLNKPPGISTHNEPGQDLISLARDHLTQNAALASTTGWKADFGPSPVHRLDRETSGLIVLATRADSASRLQQQMENREVQKFYRAIVRGQLKIAAGTWDQALSDRAEGRVSPAGKTADRKECGTHFKVVNAGSHLSEIECELLTGRTHQIRRHAVMNGHVIIGDERYGDPKAAASVIRRYEKVKSPTGAALNFKRLYLHAHRLQWPQGGVDRLPARLEAKVPEEFELILKSPPQNP